MFTARARAGSSLSFMLIFCTEITKHRDKRFLFRERTRKIGEKETQIVINFILFRFIDRQVKQRRGVRSNQIKTGQMEWTNNNYNERQQQNRPNCHWNSNKKWIRCSNIRSIERKKRVEKKENKIRTRFKRTEIHINVYIIKQQQSDRITRILVLFYCECIHYYMRIFC